MIIFALSSASWDFFSNRVYAKTTSNYFEEAFIQGQGHIYTSISHENGTITSKNSFAMCVLLSAKVPNRDIFPYIDIHIFLIVYLFPNNPIYHDALYVSLNIVVEGENRFFFFFSIISLGYFFFFFFSGKKKKFH